MPSEKEQLGNICKIRLGILETSLRLNSENLITKNEADFRASCEDLRAIDEGIYNHMMNKYQEIKAKYQK